MCRLIPLVAIALIVAAAPSPADTILVDWTGAGDYETIGEGVAAAGTGDTVLVAAGTYSGENNRNISVNYEMTIMSAGGRRSVIINPRKLFSPMSRFIRATEWPVAGTSPDSAVITLISPTVWLPARPVRRTPPRIGISPSSPIPIRREKKR